MSTFDGVIQEFPFITIDYFRRNPERPPPLACFLSHAHSDHLQGLESFRAPFIYCSSATREILLRIEKYPHRMNFNSGILESRKLHYKHLSKLLRPIPLNTPTEIDLTPKLSIRVTLLDANHCTGAAMFLIEGDGKAILYTGDIRAESWWIDSLIRHPILIPYTLGIKRLDKVYLDTTFAHTSHIPRTFPTKAEGIAELLRKLEPYPENTNFYFRAWTFGYEEVHVDRYQIGLYRSVSQSGTVEAAPLCGFRLGNRVVSGCLSEDEQSRIHSCEPGVHCSAASSKNTVYVIPIISRTDKGADIPELGAGGGLGDLYQIHELEVPDQNSLDQLEQLCSEKIHDHQALSKAKEALSAAFRSNTKVLSLDSYGMKDAHEMPLEELVNILSRGPLSEERMLLEDLPKSIDKLDRSGKPLPKTIRFPYSRHSSYAELCELVKALKPRDIHPCTVDPLDWDEDVSMESLFGHLCSDNKFVHDQYMREMTALENGERPRKRRRHNPESPPQSTQQSTVTENSTTSQASQMSQASMRTGREINDAVLTLGAHNSSLLLDPPPIRPTIASSSPAPPPVTMAQPLEHTYRTTNNPSDSGSNSDSFPIPTLSPGTAKARRHTIQQAWHYLNDAQKSRNSKFHLGSLPSSLSTNGEISGPRLSISEEHEVRELVEGFSSSQPTASYKPIASTIQQGKPPLPTSTGAKGINVDGAIDNTEPDMYHNIILETDNDKDNGSVTETDTEHETNQHHFSQNSIASSAFASQSQSQNQGRLVEDFEKETISEEEYISDAAQGHVDPDTDPAPALQLGSVLETRNRPQAQHPFLVKRKSSIRNRQAAYQAAREDNYDAWAGVSLVSAGNNHTEEEIEL
ncbi:putative DNA repair protein [Aspergillus foveolatus]|uniref:putative DNA repair protein n=1 Tax=Aspergillus foveolatus TaxID=210207 RepID=UPI003CCE420D